MKPTLSMRKALLQLAPNVIDNNTAGHILAMKYKYIDKILNTDAPRTVFVSLLAESDNDSNIVIDKLLSEVYFERGTKMFSCGPHASQTLLIAKNAATSFHYHSGNIISRLEKTVPKKSVIQDSVMGVSDLIPEAEVYEKWYSELNAKENEQHRMAVKDIISSRAKHLSSRGAMVNKNLKTYG